MVPILSVFNDCLVFQHVFVSFASFKKKLPLAE